MTQQYPGQPPQHPGQPQYAGASPQYVGPPQYAGQPPQYPGQPQYMTAPPPKKKSKTPIVVASVLALALLVGGGFLVFNLLRGATPAAAKALPSNSLAVVEVNLNPAAADKLAVKDLVEKFPALSDGMTEAGDDYKKGLWSILEQAGAPDYDTSVKPWLGDSLALAAVSTGDSASDVEPVFAVQVTDKDKAKTFAEEELPGTVVFFVDDIMVITSENSGVTEASLKDGNLSTNADYKADMGKLGSGYLATAWVSSDFSKIMSTAHPGMTTNVDSRAAAGLKVEDGTLATRVIGWQSEPVSEPGKNVTEFVGGLPGDSLMAGGFSLASSTLDMVWEQLEATGGTQEGLIASADELRALVGTEAAFSLQMTNGVPAIAMKVRTEDPVIHQEKVQELAKDMGIADVTSTVDGDVVTTTAGLDANAVNNPPSSLSGNDTYTTLIKGVSNPEVVLWADMAKIHEAFSTEMDPTTAENLEPVTGVALVSGRVDDHYSEGWLRIGTR